MNVVSFCTACFTGIQVNLAEGTRLILPKATWQQGDLLDDKNGRSSGSQRYRVPPCDLLVAMLRHLSLAPQRNRNLFIYLFILLGAGFLYLSI